MEIRIDNPCPANWDEMTGDDRARFCNLCQLNVYNLSDMSAKEAQSFMDGRAGQRTCVRYYKRTDGKVMTDECPRLLRRVRNAVVAGSRRSATALRILLAFLLGTHAPAWAQGSGDPHEMPASVKGKVAVPVKPELGRPTLGEAVIAVPATTATQAFMGDVVLPDPSVSLSVRGHLLGTKNCTTPTPAVPPPTITPSEKLRVQRAQGKMLMSKTLIAAGHLQEAERNYARAAALLSTIPGQTALLREALQNDIAMLRALGKLEDAQRVAESLAKLPDKN